MPIESARRPYNCRPFVGRGLFCLDSPNQPLTMLVHHLWRLPLPPCPIIESFAIPPRTKDVFRTRQSRAMAQTRSKLCYVGNFLSGHSKSEPATHHTYDCGLGKGMRA